MKFCLHVSLALAEFFNVFSRTNIMSSDGLNVPPSRKSALDDVTATAAASTGNSTSTQADAQMIQSESYK